MTRTFSHVAALALITGVAGGLTAAPATALGLIVDFPTLTWPITRPAPIVAAPVQECPGTGTALPATCVAPSR